MRHLRNNYVYLKKGHIVIESFGLLASPPKFLCISN